MMILNHVGSLIILEFNQYDFESWESEQFIRIANRRKSEYENSYSLRSFFLEIANISYRNKLTKYDYQRFNTSLWEGAKDITAIDFNLKIQEYIGLPVWGGLKRKPDLKLPNVYLKSLQVNSEWNDVDLAAETDSEFFYFHWSTSA